LRSFHAFEELPEAELMHLAKHMKLCSYPKKAIILKQGEPTNDIYFLVSGYVKIIRGGIGSLTTDDRRKQKRQEIVLAILGPGHMIGELASLAATRRTASVIALSECKLIQLEHNAFIECAKRNSSVSLFTMRYLASRLVESNRQNELLRSSVVARIAGLLRSLQDSGLPQDIFPSNAEIGRMVGVSGEIVSRVIQKMNSK
jgi:CRP/FNR family cyclic AMP-dependent transcriptional regulator